MKNGVENVSGARAGERGAALVTAMLVAMLLLAAGGALVVTTGMTATNAVDATAEAQAYYSAEAGMQTVLSVLRRNVASNPAGTEPTFRNVICANADPCNNSGNMSLWLPRDKGVVTVSTIPKMAYDVTVRDAAYAAGVQLPAAPYEPRYLIVTSVGYGPKGARKILQAKLDAYPFDFSAHAAVAIRSNDLDLVPMLKLDLGASDPHAWNGNDHAVPAAPPVPAFAVTNTMDYDAGDGFGLITDVPPNVQGTAEHAIGADQANVLGSQQLVKLNPASLEEWLQTADNCRLFLTQLRATASSIGRLNPGDIGTEAKPQFTFIDGDLDLKGGDHGAGLLIVTGNITQAGSSSFKGIVFALGNGKIVRNGTPDALGAVIVANFQHITNADGTITGVGNFGSPYIDSSGGGNSLVGYDSGWIRKAMNTLGSTVLGVVEK
ncbi:MAG: hypothetical protein DMF65_11525 [Acidobacteria bacterium]|nr:MAG: hypothetical protein DMF65_11525 [Acidobacteriota bacterium]